MGTRNRDLAELKQAVLCALVGLIAGTVVPAMGYSGRSGEAYSPLNHFVSELGQVGVSRWAWLFNDSLVIANISLLFFGAALTSQIQEIAFRWSFGVLAAITCTAGMLVGVYPMNQLPAHLAVAGTFFYSALAMIALHSLYILLFPVGPVGRWLAFPGLVSVLCFICFIGETTRLPHHLGKILSLLAHRPALWSLPFWEWMAITSIGVWIVVQTFTMVLRPENKRNFKI